MVYNYRVQLSDDAVRSNSEAQIQQSVFEIEGANELELIRVATNFKTSKKTISLLSRAKDSKLFRSKLFTLLLSKGIRVNNNIEAEELKEEAQQDHEHHCHGHGHSHGHEHEHEHEHQCSHTHQHDSSNHEKKPTKESNHTHAHDHGHAHNHENHWLKAGVGLVFGVGLLILSLASLNIPLIAYYIITGLTTLVSLYLGKNVYLSAWNALRQKKWDTSTLYTISTAAIVIVSIVSLFIPGLPMMCEAAPLVLGFWHLGEGIEHTLIGEINNKLDVRDCLPPLVRLRKGHLEQEISIKQLIPNDIIFINSGQVIPVDGRLIKSTFLYTTRIDGSPELKEFKAGDLVKAGMSVAEHTDALEMQVTKTYQNSYLSLIAKNIKKANTEKAPVEIFANKVLKYFIPGLIGVALISGLVIGLVFTPALAIQCVVAVLVSACPCALSLITPMAVKIGMKKASENGVHFNNGKALQAAANIDTVVFDLNGTLTKGEIEVSQFAISEPQYLRHFALLEAQSSHPAAKIIKSYIETKNPLTTDVLTLSSVDKSHHSGLKGMINGEQFMVGNKDMLAANGITHVPEPYHNPNNGAVYLVRGSTVIGQINLADPLRDDAVATVKELQRLGKTVHICTGADQATAERFAAELGIAKEHIAANTVGAVSKPGEISKDSYIQQLKRKGHKVSMVGDAANDLTAIAYSDVGVAVKSAIGDDITQKQAGIVVQKGLLFPIASAFDTAAKTKSNIFQNLAVSLTYNSIITLVAAGLFVALGFTLNPALGVALMVIESTIVLANLYRFKKQNIVSSAPCSPVEKVEEPESTTSKILHALGFSPKAKVVTRLETPEKQPKCSSLFSSQSPIKLEQETNQEPIPCRLY